MRQWALSLWRSTAGQIGCGLRYLALDRAVYWFRPPAEQRDIQVHSVFFGGQDHQRRMLVLLLQNSAQA